MKGLIEKHITVKFSVDMALRVNCSLKEGATGSWTNPLNSSKVTVATATKILNLVLECKSAEDLFSD